MNDPRIPRIVYGFLLAIGVLDWVRRYPLLPARMASHFGPHGEVTNWQSKEQLFMTMVAVVGVSFVAGFVVPQLIAVLPANMVNLPAPGILVSRGTARRDDAISGHENGMVCLRGAVLASVRDFGSNQREHAIAWTV
jgi:uncharacterized membrane protein